MGGVESAALNTSSNLPAGSLIGRSRVFGFVIQIPNDGSGGAGGGGSAQIGWQIVKGGLPS